MNKLSLGMTKQEVIDAIGEPDSTSAQGNQEDLTYIEKAVDPNTWMYIMVPCSVRLINGIVQSYGKAGDYERASQPARKYDINVHNK
jgi:hypothetical protein